jgi:parvulin-like peptidyl-prolyl isomerase
LPKRKRTTQVPTVSRLQTARQRKERSQQLLVTAIGGLIIAVIAGLTAFGFYLSQRGPGGEKALEVGNTSFNTSYVLQRVRMLSNESVLQGQIPQAQTVLSGAVANIQEEEVLRQQARTLGITLESEEIASEVGGRIGVAPDDRTTYENALKAILEQTGLTHQQYQRMIEGQLLRDKVSDHFAATVPRSADQARVRMIVVPTQADAQSVLRRLEQGEDFANLAREVSRDTASRESGGELGWIPRGLYGDTFDNAVFPLEVGQRTRPLTTELGVSIVELQEKANNRELTSDQQTLLAERLFANWLTTAIEIVGVRILLDQEKIDWIVERAFGQGG